MLPNEGRCDGFATVGSEMKVSAAIKSLLLIADQLLLTTTQPVAAAKVTNGFVSAIASTSSVESPEQKIWNQLEEVSSSFYSQQNVNIN